MTYPYPFEILLTPGRLTMIFEADSQVRRIWLEPRQPPGPDDLDPSYYGDSIGHWEGDDLVVDTIGFNTQTTVTGAPHSEQMHIVERIRYRDAKPRGPHHHHRPEAFTGPCRQTILYGGGPAGGSASTPATRTTATLRTRAGGRSGGVVPPGAGTSEFRVHGLSSAW